MQLPTEKQTSALMRMEKEVVMKLPSQEERTSRDRRSGDIVPVPAVSSSDDGPAVGSVVSLAVESAIASTSGGLEEPIEDGGRSSAPVDLALQPEVRIMRLEEGGAFLSPEMSTVKKTCAVVAPGLLGSPPASERAQSSVILEISDDEMDTDSSIAKSSDLERIAKGNVPKRGGRPPTTGEWRNIVEAKQRYLMLMGIELELEETEYILDPNSRPKTTRAKQRKLPRIEDLRSRMTSCSHLDVEKEAGRSLLFLDKLSDKSTGLNSRLVHELRVHVRRLEASLVELRHRVEHQQGISAHQSKANDYLVI
ncbi:unnamed protein product [Lasius platythorax]|uniref:Uncharacterized protein n=1 Tax=Lasius platythorax TaxID=488582 RepID=A0AAV2MYK9_9HYME